MYLEKGLVQINRRKHTYESGQQCEVENLFNTTAGES